MKKVPNRAAAIDHLGYMSDLDAMHTLESIDRYLSPQLQSRWAGKAEAVIRSGCEANFVDLTDYPDWQARVVDNRFGCLPQESGTPRELSTSHL